MTNELSQREKEVIRLLCSGLTHVEIAGKLGITRKTVNSHRERIARKTGISRSVPLVHFAIHSGIMSVIPVVAKPWHDRGRI